jgi:hypothetical protein
MGVDNAEILKCVKEKFRDKIGLSLVLWAELPGAEIRHLPGRMAIASPAELGRTGRACNFDKIHIISIKLSSKNVV